MRNKLTAIVEQLEACKYECEGGSLDNNVKFKELREMIEAKNCPLFEVGESVIYDEQTLYIFSILIYKNTISYQLSEYPMDHSRFDNNMECEEDELYSVSEYEKIQEEKAIDLLNSLGYDVEKIKALKKVN